MSNWPNNVDMGHSNYTLKFPRTSRYEGGWAKDSGTPPWGWALAIAAGMALFMLLFFGPTFAARFIGA